MSKFYWPQALEVLLAASSVLVALATLAIPVAACCPRSHGDGDNGGAGVAGDINGAGSVGGAATKELAASLIEVKFGSYYITN